MKVRYAVIIEKAKQNYSAYVPDLPGCIATGKTRILVGQKIKEAIELHIYALREAGFSVPAPSTDCQYIDASLAG